MRKLVLVCGILASVVSASMGAMSKDEWERAKHNCTIGDKSACQALIDDGLKSVEQCDKDTCPFVGVVYYLAERYREAIPYLEKAVALGDNRGYGILGATYDKLQDYYNAKKYFEIGCEKVSVAQAENCRNLGNFYYKGQGVRQDYHKAHELYKKACDMKDGYACNSLGYLYGEGQGVRENISTAKQYFGKACDLGYQLGCDVYKELNNQGVQ